MGVSYFHLFSPGVGIFGSKEVDPIPCRAAICCPHSLSFLYYWAWSFNRWSRWISQPGFWDRIAERYSKRPVADEAAYQKKLQVTREYFQPDMAVLEFGCGTGSTTITHSPYVRHIRAIDISSKMIEIAKGKAVFIVAKKT